MESWLSVILRFCGGFLAVMHGIWDLSSPIRDWPSPLSWECSLNHSEKSLCYAWIVDWRGLLLLIATIPTPCIVQGSAVHFSLVTAKLIDAVTPEADLQPHNLLTKHPWVSKKIQNPGLGELWGCLTGQFLQCFLFIYFFFSLNMLFISVLTVISKNHLYT